MSLLPSTQVPVKPPERPDAVAPAAPAERPSAVRPTASGEESHASRELQELHELASQSQLQVKFLRLPDGDVPVFRLVDSDTGRVRREFPPEALTEVLAA